MKPRIEVLSFSGCPHAEEALRMTREIVDRMLPRREVESTIVQTEEEARTWEFLGSPSIRIDGIDIEGRRGDFQGMACRVYEGITGVPPEWMIETALLRAIRPRHILFLCVANSARSQMAEGIARSLALELLFGNFNVLSDVRREKIFDYACLHPQLCVGDGGESSR